MHLRSTSKVIAVGSSDVRLGQAFRGLVEDHLRGAKRNLLHKIKVSRIGQEMLPRDALSLSPMM